MSNGVTIIGRRAGTLTVLAVDRKHMTAQCDCGRVVRLHSSTIYRKSPTCGDAAAHPRERPKHGLWGGYIYFWHAKHQMCKGWEDVVAFVASVGERPEGNALYLDGDVARCGTCDQCITLGAERNAKWVAGRLGRGAPVLRDGEWMSQSEAARRLGISRQAFHQRADKSTPEAPRSDPGAPRPDGAPPVE